MTYRLFFLALACLNFSVLHAKIIETPHIADALELIDQDTWVLVDLDNTLFETETALGHAHWFYNMLQEKIQQGMSWEEAMIPVYAKWASVQPLCRVKPLEETFVPSLSSLQDQGIVVMGFTLRQPWVSNFTLDQVASLGVDFTKTAPSQEAFTVPAAHLAIYQSGVLFASDYNTKGGVFLSFLNTLGKTPKKIVFLDDKKGNVEELEKLLPQLGIEYIGIYYTAYQHVKPVYDRRLAEVQYRFLHQQILSNEAAELLIQHDLYE